MVQRIGESIAEQLKPSDAGIVHLCYCPLVLFVVGVLVVIKIKAEFEDGCVSSKCTGNTVAYIAKRNC